MASLIVFNVSLLALRVSCFRVFLLSRFLRFRVFCVFGFSRFLRFLSFRVFCVFALSAFSRFRIFAYFVPMELRSENKLYSYKL